MPTATYTGPETVKLSCLECGGEHLGEYHHEGIYGEGPIFIVICDVENPEGLADFYTSALVVDWNPARLDAAALGIELKR